MNEQWIFKVLLVHLSNLFNHHITPNFPLLWSYSDIPFVGSLYFLVVYKVLKHF